MTQSSTIAVLGGGYAGLFAAQRAARAARARRSAVRGSSQEITSIMR